jgi:hypothetical protein
MEFDKHAPPLCVDKRERVHPKALHHSEAPGDGPVRHDPAQHVRYLALQLREIPEVVVLATQMSECVHAPHAGLTADCPWGTCKPGISNSSVRHVNNLRHCVAPVSQHVRNQGTASHPV